MKKRRRERGFIRPEGKRILERNEVERGGNLSGKLNLYSHNEGGEA